jgi:phosphate transport system protein
MKALLDGDGALAEDVIAKDVEINDLEKEIDEECTLLLARRQPVARDLRFVVSAIKIVTDLERMGDESVRIARMAIRLAERGDPGRQHQEVRHLGTHVRGMLRDALDALARMDLALALKVIEEDRAVDREYDSITRELITFMMEDPRFIPRALEVQWSARALERIGDRTCNIAECVFYFVKGNDVRHSSIEKLRSEARD